MEARRPDKTFACNRKRLAPRHLDTRTATCKPPTLSGPSSTTSHVLGTKTCVDSVQLPGNGSPPWQHQRREAARPKRHCNSGRCQLPGFDGFWHTAGCRPAAKPEPSPPVRGMLPARAARVSIRRFPACLAQYIRFRAEVESTSARMLERSAAEVDATAATFNRGKLTAVSPPTQARGDDAGEIVVSRIERQEDERPLFSGGRRRRPSAVTACFCDQVRVAPSRSPSPSEPSARYDADDGDES